VADWWRARAQVDARARMVGDVMKVVVRNRSNGLVRGVVVRVLLPDSKLVSRADGELLRSPARTARLLVPPLAPRATRTLTIALVPSR
jgi:hypothetical protein